MFSSARAQAIQATASKLQATASRWYGKRRSKTDVCFKITALVQPIQEEMDWNIRDQDLWECVKEVRENFRGKYSSLFEALYYDVK